MPTPRARNLPAPYTSLIGREDEVSRTTGLIVGGSERLVTLTGVGGCGKTRLALEVAGGVADAFPDGVCFVELASVSDPSLVSRVVATAWGLAEAPRHETVQLLIDALQDKVALLVLDNCEHLIDACAEFVDGLLSVCPGLRVLATSREPLQIAGERQCHVPPLAVPQPGQDVSPEAVGAYPSVRLFVERANAVDADFRITAENAAAVAGICTLLDGIPLALELAAARIGVLTPAQIGERLQDCFRLLVGTSRSAPRRQQTLKAALDWSYALLSEEESRAFRRFSLFVDGWTLDAAEAVCDAGVVEGTDVLDVMSRLVDKSLVLVAERGGAARYRFLEPIRQYARARLTEAGEDEDACARVTDYYLDLAGQAELALHGPSQSEWLLHIDAELDNLRALVFRSIEREQYEVPLRLGGSLYWYLWMRHHLREGQTWLATCLQAGRSVPRAVRAKALMAVAMLCSFLGDYHKGVSYGTEALELMEKCGTPQDLAWTLVTLGYVSFGDGRLESAREYADRGLVVSRESASPWHLGHALLLAGQIARVEGDRAEARASFEESRAAFERHGDKWGVDSVVQALAELDDAQADVWRQGAMAAVRLCWEQGNEIALIGALEYLAGRLQAGQPEVQVLVLAAAEGARERLAAPPTLGERADVDRYLAEARESLGSARYAEAWSQGRAMSLDALVTSLLDHGVSDLALRSTGRHKRTTASRDGLTRREEEVAKLVALGRTDQEIAEELFITRGTASLHVHHILQKLGLRSRVQVADWAVDRGLVDPS